MAHSNAFAIFGSSAAFQGNRELGNFYFFKKGFTDEEVAKILGVVSDLKPAESEVSAPPKTDAGDAPAAGDASAFEVNDQYRRSAVRWIPLNEANLWLYAKLGAFTNKANTAVWRFDIIGLSEIQFAEYDSRGHGHYDWHLDVGKHNPDRKISLSVQLSAAEEYDGGDLQLMMKREPMTASRERGTVIAFPSYALHRVTPVTRGVRRSLVVWVSGPPYR
jgi:PKHD-type hydroxylase